MYVQMLAEKLFSETLRMYCGLFKVLLTVLNNLKNISMQKFKIYLLDPRLVLPYFVAH